MASTLHILNGDSTLEQFKKADIPGETFVWREVIAEGPVNPEFNSDAFWNERRDFITSFFDVKPEDYDRDLYTPFQELVQRFDKYDEVILWFEYDLFCQINMMALIAFLGSLKTPQQTISMICAGRIDDSGKLYGLGELSLDQFKEQLDKKLKLNTREFDLASDVYQAYTSPNPDELFTYTILPSDEFWYLADALKAHFKRFPNSISGLTEIEQKIIDLASEGIESSNELVGKLLKWQEYYGFGDLQYFNALNSLKPLFEDFNSLKLKTEPELSSAIQNINRNIKLGGASLAEWSYDPTLDELFRKTNA